MLRDGEADVVEVVAIEVTGGETQTERQGLDGLGRPAHKFPEPAAPGGREASTVEVAVDFFLLLRGEVGETCVSRMFLSGAQVPVGSRFVPQTAPAMPGPKSLLCITDKFLLRGTLIFPD